MAKESYFKTYIEVVNNNTHDPPNTFKFLEAKEKPCNYSTEEVIDRLETDAVLAQPKQ